MSFILCIILILISLEKEKDIKAKFEAILETLPNPMYSKANPEDLSILKTLVIQMRYLAGLSQTLHDKLS
ncbi:hypothetical protein HMI54_005488 [Coelomomyces lativittatus]|nr:hypothetical protein HMI54_005488 [Coelomomyces lativittatus]